MNSLTADAVITPDAVLSPGTVVIDDGVIVDVVAGGSNPMAATLAPGFVDLQVNGIGEVNVADAKGDDWATSTSDSSRRASPRGAPRW